MVIVASVTAAVSTVIIIINIYFNDFYWNTNNRINFSTAHTWFLFDVVVVVAVQTKGTMRIGSDELFCFPLFPISFFNFFPLLTLHLVKQLTSYTIHGIAIPLFLWILLLLLCISNIIYCICVVVYTHTSQQRATKISMV